MMGVKNLKSKNLISYLAAAVFIFSASAQAAAQELAVGGQALGISMDTQGVVVSSVSAVETGQGEVSPGENAGILAGDIITELDGKAISDGEDFVSAVKALDGSEIKICILRDGKSKTLSITPAKSSEGGYKLGLWLKDCISGIGTLTFYDPQTGVYGALGHSISDSGTGSIFPLRAGKVSNAEISGVIPGKAGEPGCLQGAAGSQAIGDIQINCDEGIFGEAQFAYDGVLETGEMKSGPATILCTVGGKDTGEYSIEVNKLYKTGDGVTALITVTDEELISVTGGIVQGMSGSPIIQDGKLVGAVTHVLVNEPEKGYAISIQDMLRAAEALDSAA